MRDDINAYNLRLSDEEKKICDFLAQEIITHLPEATYKIWHAHPVWFLEGNPVVGYSHGKRGVRLLFWSGQSFLENGLQKTGSFQASEVIYTHREHITKPKLLAWLQQAKDIQWDYKNIVKNKGVLVRLK